ncbi:hypothetical protein [Winogradskyella vincentii]|uniref:DUF669 domain-containing protein n=1 Tax=Winogradskyella vincentii TaxID=2877122 RepID=A0ABS7XVR5_9FLAO|nr:hypothetical protein [Winogradskyella vincentii]MCA0151729.1 hypothetical protein [Winogradskyella vincentii]
MTNFKEIINEETGEKQFLFNAELLKIGEKTLENSNGKEYKIVTLKFNLPSGEEVERSAICYASNYNHGIEQGRQYLCNLSFTEEGDPQINMSHLTNADRASAEDFAGLFQMQEQLIKDDLVM